MATNGANGTSSSTNSHIAGPVKTQSDRFDPEFTQKVIDTMGPKTSDRNRVVLGSLIQHLHDFAREVELTNDEWMAGVDFVNAVGQMYTKTRNEAHRVSDVLGLESLVDEIAHKIVSEGKMDPTSSSILGPFWSAHAPFRENGDSIMVDPIPQNGQVTRMHGVISDCLTGKPIPGAVFDIWQASSNGKYDFQDPDNQTPNNLRGKFRANEKGEYSLLCLHPTAYSLPTDGPAFALLNVMDRHPMRPAHIHIMVTHPEYTGCTTQLYPREDEWLATDTVFAVKPDLILDFKPAQNDPKASLDLKYDVILSPKGYKGKV